MEDRDRKIRQQEESGHMIREPESPMKKWITAAIAMVIGMLVVGMAWFAVSFLSGDKNEPVETAPTMAAVEQFVTPENRDPVEY